MLSKILSFSKRVSNPLHNDLTLAFLVGLAILTLTVVFLYWVDWFNNRRLFEPIGNVPPREKEIEYYQKLQGSAMAA